LAQVFALQQTVPGAAEGELYGKLLLPFRGGNVYSSGGFLYSVPGQSGRSRLDQADALLSGFPQDDPRLPQAEEALKDLSFDFLRVDFGGGNGKTNMTIRIAGRSGSNPGLPPVKLNTNIEADLNELIDVGRLLRWFRVVSRSNAGATAGPCNCLQRRSVFMSRDRMCRVLLAVALAPVLLGGCVKVKAEHKVVEPIEINTNVKVQVEEKLNAVFSDIDASNETMTAPEASDEPAPAEPEVTE